MDSLKSKEPLGYSWENIRTQFVTGESMHVLGMIMVLLATSICLILPFIGAERLSYWWSWRRRWVIAVLIMDTVALSLVGGIALFASVKGGWNPQGNEILTTVPPTILANLSLRLHRTGSPRGDSLALSMVRFAHDLLDRKVENNIGLWVRHLGDSELAIRAEQFDVKPLGAQSARKARVEWRDEQLQVLRSAEEIARARARAALENSIVELIVVSQRAKPNE